MRTLLRVLKPVKDAVRCVIGGVLLGLDEQFSTPKARSSWFRFLYAMCKGSIYGICQGVMIAFYVLFFREKMKYAARSYKETMRKKQKKEHNVTSEPVNEDIHRAIQLFARSKSSGPALGKTDYIVKGSSPHSGLSSLDSSEIRRHRKLSELNRFEDHDDQHSMSGRSTSSGSSSLQSLLDLMRAKDLFPTERKSSKSDLFATSSSGAAKIPVSFVDKSKEPTLVTPATVSLESSTAAPATKVYYTLPPRRPRAETSTDAKKDVDSHSHLTRSETAPIGKLTDEDSESRSRSRSSVIWKPDSASNACEVCSKEFTILKRRHHCRKCGALVCAGCAPYVKLDGHQTSTRVCTECQKVSTRASQ